MSAFRTISAVALALLVAGVAGQAGATLPAAVGLANGATVSYDGLTFTVGNNCAFISDGGSSQACSAADDYIEISNSTRGQPTVEILGDGSGDDGNSGTVTKGSNALACYKCPAASSLSFTLTVTQQSGGKTATVTSYSNAIAGTPSSASITAGTTWSGNNTSLNLATMPSQTVTFSAAFPSLAVSLNLAANAGSTLTLATDALHFSPAPEPGSIAVFATGVVGLTATRRWKARRGQMATQADLEGGGSL